MARKPTKAKPAKSSKHGGGAEDEAAEATEVLEAASDEPTDDIVADVSDEAEHDEGLQAAHDAEAEGADDEGTDDELNGSAKKGGLWPVDRLKPVLEALVFAAADPVPVRRMYQIITGSTKAEVVAALAELQAECEARGVRLVEVAGGWQFRTAPEHHEVIKRLFKERPYRLTRAGIETLAVVAYRQPVTRAEIESIRGVDASGVLEGLVERKLVRIAGRRDVPGRPLVYETTGEFLEVFGLKNLEALPTLAELGDEVLSMADRAGIDQNDERDAPILPLEEGDSGDETQASDDDQGAHGEVAERRGRFAGSNRTEAREAEAEEGDEQVGDPALERRGQAGQADESEREGRPS